jgi:hypothetical protein
MIYKRQEPHFTENAHGKSGHFGDFGAVNLKFKIED